MTKTNFLPRVTPLGVVVVSLLLCVAGWTLKTGLLITIPGGDGETQHLPSRALAGEMYRAGHLPLWNRFESSGIPLAALVQPGSFYPPNIFLYTLLPYKLAFNLSLILHFLLLAYFMRRYLQALHLSASAVTFGTIAWSLSGFLLMHSSAVPIFNAVVWIPACFYCTERWIQTQRWRYPAYTGVCLALSLLAGWAQILALCALYLCLYGAMAWREINHRKKFLLGFFVAFAISALMVMPQVVLTMGFKPYTSLRSLDWHLFASASYPPQLLLTLLFPGFFYSFAGGSLFKPMLWWGPPDSAIMTIYVGILPLYLALAALPRWRSSRTVRFFSLLAVLAAWMAFGAYTPLGSLLYRLPVFQFFHDHWVNFVFVSFALAVLAAHGIDNLGFPELSRRAAVAWRAATCVIPLALAAFVLTQARWLVRSIDPKISPLVQNWFFYFHQTVKLRNPGVMLPLFLLLLSSAFFWIWSSRPGSNLLGRVAIVLVAVDLGLFGFCTIPWVAPGDLQLDSRKIVDFMREHAAGQPYRAFTLQTGDALLNVNANSLSRYASIVGYEPFLPLPYADLLSMNTGGTTSFWPQLIVNNRILSLLNVRYIIAGEYFSDRIKDLTGDGDVAAADSKDTSENLLIAGSWKPIGTVDELGATSSFRSDGKGLGGISQEHIPLEKNSIYQLSYRARADEGRQDTLLAIIASGDNVEYCLIRDFMLSSHYERNTCLHLTSAADENVDVKLFTLSRAKVYVTDMNLTKVGDLPASGADYRVAATAGTLTLLENKSVLPRAFFVRSVVPVSNYTDARSELWQMTSPLNLQTSALVEGIDRAESQLDTGKVDDLSYTPNEADLQVSCDGKCFLVLADQYFPGWKAFVDGAQSNIYRTDAVVGGIWVPSGKHTIRFAYDPRGLNWGMVCAAVGVLLVGFAVWWDRKQA